MTPVLLLLQFLLFSVTSQAGLESSEYLINRVSDDSNQAISPKVDLTFQHFSYAGPMAVMQLANDWKGKLKSGKDAISFIQAELSTTYNNFTIGYVQRKSHQFSLGNDLAKGFYYYNNEIRLGDKMQINAKMESKVYAGAGLRIAHKSNFSYLNHQFSVTPSIVTLRLDEIIWGGFDGNLFYSSPDEGDWGGTIHLDYGYTEDSIARRPLKGEYLGWLYGLDLDLAWSNSWIEAKYSGINVFGRIYWDEMPKTTATISTESAFYLIGPEYFEDSVLNPPTLHYLEASTPLSFADTALKAFLVPELYSISQNMRLFSSAQITPIRSFYYHGFQYRTEPGVLGSDVPIKLGVQHDFSSRTTKLSLQHEYVSMEFASQTMDVSKSQQLVLSLGVHVQF